MSKMYSHTSANTVGVDGIERHHFRRLCAAITFSVLDLEKDTEAMPHPIRYMFPNIQYHGQKWAASAKTAITTADIAGDNTFFRTVILNTALAVGSDQLKLAARLDGQCEAHAFVEGSNREWLAKIIEGGVHLGIFHADSGWQTVIELLRSCGDEPIVTSYSAGRSFPNSHIAIQEGLWFPPTDEDEDDVSWHKLPTSEQWNLAMNALRVQSEYSRVELTPSDWGDYRFEGGMTAFHLV